jgi:hypothetical protein
MTLVLERQGSRTCRAVSSRTASQLTIGTDVQITVTSYSYAIQKVNASLLTYLQLTGRKAWINSHIPFGRKPIAAPR